MVEHVHVIVNNVENSEIGDLDMIVHDLRRQKHDGIVFNRETDARHYRIRLQPASLDEIKHTLRFVLRIVNPERIAIEP